MLYMFDVAPDLDVTFAQGGGQPDGHDAGFAAGIDAWYGSSPSSAIATDRDRLAKYNQLIRIEEELKS